MKHLLITIIFITASSSLFATKTTSITNHSGVVDKVEKAWKKSQTMTAEQDKDDLLIGYGGQDISLRPTVAKQSTTS